MLGNGSERNFTIASVIAIMAGCHSSAQTGPPGTVTSDGTVIRPNQVPVAVSAAFSTEHPYAKMTQAAERTQQGEADQYTVQYTRPDGSTGKATYSGSGALLNDN